MPRADGEPDSGARCASLEDPERRNRSTRITAATSAFALPLSPVNMLLSLYRSEAARIARPCDFFLTGQAVGLRRAISGV
jgi:hypothetical protein